MLSSMTAFARIEIKQDFGTIIWEMRAVNQRFLEAYFRLPEDFRSLENSFRDKIKQRISRGKVECSLHLDLAKQENKELNLNYEYAERVINSLKSLQTMLGEGNINLTDILRYPGVVQNDEQDIDAISHKLLETFDIVLDNLIEMRQREGATIKELIIQRLDKILIEVAKVRMKMPQIIQWQRDKLLTKFSEINLQFDPVRLEQELVFMAQRVDVAEELDRLESHVRETMNILNSSGAVGRRLDFMMQELNREANTLGSKSIDNEVTNSGIELKVLIEQMREQIQNLE